MQPSIQMQNYESQSLEIPRIMIHQKAEFTEVSSKTKIYIPDVRVSPKALIIIEMSLHFTPKMDLHALPCGHHEKWCSYPKVCFSQGALETKRNLKHDKHRIAGSKSWEIAFWRMCFKRMHYYIFFALHVIKEVNCVLYCLMTPGLSKDI